MHITYFDFNRADYTKTALNNYQVNQSKVSSPRCAAYNPVSADYYGPLYTVQS